MDLLAPLREAPEETALLFDVDGTLAPIAARPEVARVPAETRVELARLARSYLLVACISGRPGEEAAPVFAFNVTSSDPEVFYVVASTDHCDCSWHLSLKCSDSKRSDTYEINNGGKPFRTMAANRLPRYYTSLDKKILR